jgi:hypothetical protein
MQSELQSYLDGFRASIEARMSALERESNQAHRNMITAEQAQKIWRIDTLKINAYTRLTVAIVAALAVIGNGTSNVLVDHTESRAMARYEHITDEKLATYEGKIAERNHALAFDAAQQTRNLDALQIEALIVKAGKQP